MHQPRIKTEVKDSSYEELERVLDQFLMCHMKIVLGDFNENLGREDTFNPAIGKESLHEISGDNMVKVVQLSTSKT
jgi:hypothetical protein